MSVRGVFTALAIGALCSASLIADEMPYKLSKHGKAFSVPGGIGGGQGLFSARLGGAVNRSSGPVSVDWGPARTFSFNNRQSSGSFSFTVHGITHFAEGPARGPDVRRIGRISGGNCAPPDSGSSVPEPSTVLLLLSGACGMFVLRRRFSNG